LGIESGPNLKVAQHIQKHLQKTTKTHLRTVKSNKNPEIWTNQTNRKKVSSYSTTSAAAAPEIGTEINKILVKNPNQVTFTQKNHAEMRYKLKN